MKTEKQSLGEFFTETRKEKGISMDEVVRDTNIPRKYLESIEADNFDVFPGETYAVGFIANYADALEVDRDLVINMYKRQMKVEQESPLEELVGRKKRPVINNNTVMIAVAAAVTILLVFLITMGVRQGQLKAEEAERNRPTAYFYSFDTVGSVVQQRFRVGDTVTITNNNTNDQKTILFNFQSVGANRNLSLKINANTISVRGGELFSVDADYNGTNDLGIEVISAREKDIRLSVTVLREAVETLGTNVSGALFSQVKDAVLSESELLTTNARSETSLKIMAAGTAFLSYAADNREPRDASLTAGSTVSISFSDHLTLYLGNGGAVKMTVGGREETGGGWGEVSKSLIYWKEKNGQHTLYRAILK